MPVNDFWSTQCSKALCQLTPPPSSPTPGRRRKEWTKVKSKRGFAEQPGGPCNGVPHSRPDWVWKKSRNILYYSPLAEFWGTSLTLAPGRFPRRLHNHCHYCSVESGFPSPNSTQLPTLSPPSIQTIIYPEMKSLFSQVSILECPCPGNLLLVSIQ